MQSDWAQMNQIEVSAWSGEVCVCLSTRKWWHHRAEMCLGAVAVLSGVQSAASLHLALQHSLGFGMYCRCMEMSSFSYISILMEWETILWLICLQTHVQTQRLQLCHRTFLSSSSSLFLLCPFFCNLPICPPPIFQPPWKFTCKVMKWCRHTSVCATPRYTHTLHPYSIFESYIHMDTLVYIIAHKHTPA